MKERNGCREMRKIDILKEDCETKKNTEERREEVRPRDCLSPSEANWTSSVQLVAQFPRYPMNWLFRLKIFDEIVNGHFFFRRLTNAFVKWPVKNSYFALTGRESTKAPTTNYGIDFNILRDQVKTFQTVVVRSGNIPSWSVYEFSCQPK